MYLDLSVQLVGTTIVMKIHQHYKCIHVSTEEYQRFSIILSQDSRNTPIKCLMMSWISSIMSEIRSGPIKINFIFSTFILFWTHYFIAVSIISSSTTVIRHGMFWTIKHQWHTNILFKIHAYFLITWLRIFRMKFQVFPKWNENKHVVMTWSLGYKNKIFNYTLMKIETLNQTVFCFLVSPVPEPRHKLFPNQSDFKFQFYYSMVFSNETLSVEEI